MEILLKPQKLAETNYWHSKKNGVILVKNESDIDKLWNLLCDQDSYWKDYKKVIKVLPKEIENEKQIEKMCEYCGKTDIYRLDEIRSKIDFFMYQYSEYQYPEYRERL